MTVEAYDITLLQKIYMVQIIYLYMYSEILLEIRR